MTPGDLEAVFSELAIPAPGSLTARPLAIGCGRYRVARQGDGAAAFLIQVEEEGGSRPGEQLANLSYFPRVRLRVERHDGVEEGGYSVLSCRSSDLDLRRYFFRVVAALLEELGGSPSVAAADAGIRRLLELFRALENPGKRSLQGLWAELLLIARSQDPCFAACAWHAEPAAMHDFAAGNDRLEVKSTSRIIRQHHFRLEQLASPPGGRLVVASVMLTSSEDGVTIRELVERVSSLLPADTEHRSRFEAIVASSIGSDWRLISTAGFDEDLAVASLRFFPGESIPSVARDTPVEVSEVRFLVDLSGVSVDGVDLVGTSPLFRVLLR